RNRDRATVNFRGNCCWRTIESIKSRFTPASADTDRLCSTVSARRGRENRSVCGSGQRSRTSRPQTLRPAWNQYNAQNQKRQKAIYSGNEKNLSHFAPRMKPMELPEIELAVLLQTT